MNAVSTEILQKQITHLREEKKKKKKKKEINIKPAALLRKLINLETKICEKGLYLKRITGERYVGTVLKYVKYKRMKNYEVSMSKAV